MKPRHAPLPLTDDDSDIWFHHVWGDDWRNVRLYNHSQASDRRDADLMLELMLDDSRRQYLNLRRYALSVGGTSFDWPDWPKGDLP